jgi:hypothetical protein
MGYTVVVKIPTTRLVIAGSAVVVFLLCVYAFVYRVPDVVITRTENGFRPARVTIQKGQAVIFASETSTQFWPASDFHPTHSMYPAFDPKAPVEPGSTWRFVFTEAGVWTFHDHLDERAQGTIIVVGESGESMRACINSSASSSAGVRAQCFAAQLTETLQNDGIEAAFNEYARLYQEYPSFRGLSCHDAGHILGAEAYRIYENSRQTIDRPETSYCGYGFYHGFIEAMGLEHGWGNYDEIRWYCNELKENGVLNNAAGACYHGIGHAVFDSLPSATWSDETSMVRSAINTCEIAVSEPDERAQCADGVFNALAVAKSARQYGLSFDPSPSLSLCAIQQPEYRDGCYKEYGIGLIREHRMTRTEALSLVRAQKTTDTNGALLFGYIGDEAIRSIPNLDLNDFRKTCMTFTGTHRASCIRGVLAGLNQAATPGSQYVTMFAFCAEFPAGKARLSCYTNAVDQSKNTASDKRAFAAACMLIPEPSLHTRCE